MSCIPAKVGELIASESGFQPSEFYSVNGDIASSHLPTADDFTIEGFAASDADGNVITGFTSGLTADIQ